MKRNSIIYYFLFLLLSLNISSIIADEEILNSSFIYHSVNVITGEYCEVESDIGSRNVAPIKIRRMFNAPKMTEWQFNLPSILTPSPLAPLEDRFPDRKIVYEYREDNKLQKVETRDIDGKKIFNSVNFTYELSKNPKCEATFEDGQNVRYEFMPAGKATDDPDYLLSEVTRNHLSTIKYHYCSHPLLRKKLISLRENSGGNYLINEYYEEGPHIGKVKLQKEPLGSDASPIISRRFVYQENLTEVYDALGNKTVYHFSSDNNLTAIDNFLNGVLYRSEKTFWKKINGNDPPQIISRIIEDGEGNIISCQAYTYDKKGRIIKKTLYGNLTGKNSCSLFVDDSGIPQENGVDSYSSSYIYSDDEKSVLLEEREDDGRAIRYFYYPSTNLLRAKLYLKDNAAYMRQFYHYDDLGLITKTITDDGFSGNEEDLTEVSERKIVAYQLKQESPAFGLPVQIEERYLDLSSKQEILIKRTVNHYNAQGLIQRQDDYSSDNLLYASRMMEYDKAGHVIISTDLEGSIEEYKYDSTGNCIFKKDAQKETNFFYDYANRLIRTEEKSKDACINSHYRYNYLGQKTAYIDNYGNETLYEYDGLGRLIKTIYPEVLDQNNQPVFYSEKKEYDILNRLVSLTDPNGYFTKIHYNIRGKPVEIIYQDDTKELFTYSLNGNLIESRNKNGFCRYDYQGLVIRKDVFDTNNKMLSSQTTVHSAFHIVDSEDSEGEQIHYTYDYAGKPIRIERKNRDGINRKEYVYDARGEVLITKDWLNTHEYIQTLVCRDSSYNVNHIELLTSSGKLLKEIPTSLERNKDSLSEISCSIANDRGQNVLMKVLTDEGGNTQSLVFDAMGRIEKQFTKNCLEELTSFKEMRWDGCGNKICETHLSLCPGRASKTIKTEWKYGPNNRLEVQIEGVGSVHQKQTLYQYNSSGFLQSIVKPNRVILHHAYNSYGLLNHLYSSDNSVDYWFDYDSHGNILQVNDLIRGEQTKRDYDSFNRMTSETLGNGLTISRNFDEIGRPTNLILPDGSSVQYTYDKIYLKGIHRITKEGQKAYSHYYSQYDGNGRVVSADLIGDIGVQSFSYNSLGGYSTIETPFWSERREPEKRQIADPMGTYRIDYGYDSKHQLVNENENSYVYDSLGNRTSKDNETYAYNHFHELLTKGNTHYKYDLNGNLIEKIMGNSSFKYRYDALDRLIQVAKDDNLIIDYSYDSFYRRLTKTTQVLDEGKWKKTENLRFLYEGDNEIGAVSPEGDILELRVLGLGMGAEIGASVAFEFNHHIYAPIHDSQGSVCCLIDLETKMPAEFYRYSAFGELVYIHERAILNPWLFSSKRYEEETGLVYFGKRYYDPSIGRWTTRDPLGFFDSPNLYLYALNNPVSRVDLYGLFSFEHLWSNICHTYKKSIHLYNEFATFISRIDHYITANISYLPYVRPDIEHLAEKLFSNGMLLMLGFYCDHPEIGVQGEGELNDSLRITFINGILNARSDCIEAAALISKAHGDINVHYIFHPTGGWAKDMIKCLTSKLGLLSPSGIHLAHTWKKLIDEMGGIEGGGSIVHYAHSIGGTDTYNAKCLLTPAELRMIKVITFGSATIIPEGGFGMVVNYVNYRDGVTYLDPIGYIRALALEFPNIIFTGSFWGIPFVDHALDSYAKILDILAKDILQVYDAN